MNKIDYEETTVNAKATRSVSSETRARLIAVAEHLIGARGLSGVSATDILEAAGQRNRSAIQYHFRSLDGLIDAALLERMRVIDAARWPLFEAAAALTDRDARIDALLDAAFTPLLEEAAASEEGRLRVRFMAQAIVRPTLDLEAFARFVSKMAVFQIISQLLQLRRTPAEPDELVMRARLASIQLLTTAAEWASYWRDSVRQDEARAVLRKAGRALLVD